MHTNHIFDLALDFECDADRSYLVSVDYIRLRHSCPDQSSIAHSELWMNQRGKN